MLLQSGWSMLEWKLLQVRIQNVRFIHVSKNKKLRSQSSLTLQPLTPLQLQAWYCILASQTSVFIKHSNIILLSLTDSASKRPIPLEAKTWSLPEKSVWINGEMKEFLNGILSRSSDLANRVDQLDAAHRDGFPCHSQECPEVFPLHSSRVR